MGAYHVLWALDNTCVRVSYPRCELIAENMSAVFALFQLFCVAHLHAAPLILMTMIPV